MSKPLVETENNETTAEILKLQMRLLQALEQLSYYSGEAVILAPAEEHTDNCVTVSFSYVRRNDDNMEVKIANGLRDRLMSMLVEWNEWAAQQVHVNDNDPY